MLLFSFSVASGFWEAYTAVRSYLHEIVRRELKMHPAPIYFTGHSLGGALATFAALDISLHTIPRVNAFLKHQEKYATVTLFYNVFSFLIFHFNLFILGLNYLESVEVSLSSIVLPTRYSSLGL
jgi:hypothetical protein